MGTLTAQILIGTGHPNHGGIGPSHYMFLSENSVISLALVQQNLFPERGEAIPGTVWIPTVENCLEDAVLMTAVHVVQEPGVIRMAQNFNNKMVDSDRFELYNELTDEQRRELYEKCRLLDDFPKLVISVFDGSVIARQVHVMKEYSMDVVVCTPDYFRIHTQWSKDPEIWGELDRPAE